MRRALISTLVAIGGVAHAGPSQDLERAQRYFKGKQCDEAVPVLKDLLYPKPQLARTSELCEAHVLLGVCHYEQGKREDAKSEFEACLAIDPTKTLEPLIFSEGQVRLFDEVRSDAEARAKRDRELRELEEERERIRRLVENTQAFETRSFAVNFAPLGGGQFQNGHRRKGLAVAVGQTVMGLTSLGTFLYLAQEYGLEGKVPIEDIDSVNRLTAISASTGWAFFGIYIYSVVDAIIYFKPRVRTEVDPALREELKKKRPAPKTSSFQIAPMPLPGGAGIGISWESD